MRKLLITVVLPLLLLLGQQGQAWHEVQHAAGRAGSSSSHPDGKRQPADKVCEACLAFAHLGAALAATPPALGLLPLQQGCWLPHGGRTLAADAPQQRSRGPPAFH